MGLDEIESDQRGSGDKKLYQMIPYEHIWHMESDKIRGDQILDQMIGSYQIASDDTR